MDDDMKWTRKLRRGWGTEGIGSERYWYWYWKYDVDEETKKRMGQIGHWFREVRGGDGGRVNYQGSEESAPRATMAIPGITHSSSSLSPSFRGGIGFGIGKEET